MLGNFLTIFNSSFGDIHLCAIFHAQDTKRYGFNSMRESLVNDLKVLETEEPKIPMFKHLIHGTVVRITGDNLGLYSLFVFVEWFEKNCFQSVFCVNDSSVVLRTLEMHTQLCQTIPTAPTLPHVYSEEGSCLLS